MAAGCSAASCRSSPRGAGLRPRQLLRGGTRGRRRLLRPVPDAPSRSAAQPRHRRCHRQGHRGRPAHGVLAAAAACRDRPHDRARPRRWSGPTRPRPASAARRCSSPPCARDSTSGRDTCASPTRGMSRRCSCPADGSPIRALSGAGPLLGAFDRLDVPEIIYGPRAGRSRPALHRRGDRRAIDRRLPVRRRAPPFDDRGGARWVGAGRGRRDLRRGRRVPGTGGEPADDITIVAVGRLRSPR